MKIYILRHGDASYQAPSDAERALTDRGKSETHTLLSQQLSNIERPCRVISSPYRRAQETAAIAAEHLSVGSVDTWDCLQPSGHIQHVLNGLEAIASSNVMLVSHQPLVGQLINQFAALEPGRYSMGTSALAALSVEELLPGCMDLLWLRQPGDSP